MKRLISLAIAAMLVFSVSCVAFAAEETFVPSITDKGAPEIVTDDEGNIAIVLDSDGNVISKVPAPCLLITPVSEAETSELIPEAAKDLLLHVYNSLNNGSMLLPTEKLDEKLEPNEVVIRDLFDMTWICQEASPTHEEMIEPEGVVLQMTFKVKGLGEDPIYVMTYKNDEWNPITEVINNGDGTITCTFEHLCPVAFIVGEDIDSPDTGSFVEKDLTFWLIILAVSSVALMAVLVVRRKEVR